MLNKSSDLARWLLLLALSGGGVASHGAPPVAKAAPTAAAAQKTDPVLLARELQSLSWDQFKQVVSSVPRLKESVDAYGTTGWQLVRMNYRNYPWQKHLEKMEEPQRQKLALLIAKAKGGKA